MGFSICCKEFGIGLLPPPSATLIVVSPCKRRRSLEIESANRESLERVGCGRNRLYSRNRLFVAGGAYLKEPTPCPSLKGRENNVAALSPMPQKRPPGVTCHNGKRPPEEPRPPQWKTTTLVGTCLWHVMGANSHHNSPCGGGRKVLKALKKSK